MLLGRLDVVMPNVDNPYMEVASLVLMENVLKLLLSRIATFLVSLFKHIALYAPCSMRILPPSGLVNSYLRGSLPSSGKKYTDIVTYQVMNETQILEYEKMLNSDGTATVDRSYFTTQFQTYNNYMLTGECAVLLLDPSLYVKLVEAGRLKKLSDVFAEVPSSAIDEYGIRLSETAIYKNSETLSMLPGDTVLCLSLPYVFGNSGNEKAYANMTAMFVAMVR